MQEHTSLISLIFLTQVSRFCPEKTDLKDYALPNASWCPDMLSLYQEFLEKTKADGWIKLPSFKSNRDHIQGLKLPFGFAVDSGKNWPVFISTAVPAHRSQVSQHLPLCSKTLGKDTHRLPTLS